MTDTDPPRRAVALAARGLGATSPDPVVGSANEAGPGGHLDPAAVRPHVLDVTTLGGDPRVTATPQYQSREA